MSGASEEASASESAMPTCAEKRLESLETQIATGVSKNRPLVHLNVGGRPVTIPLSLLQKYPQSMLGRMFTTNADGEFLWRHERDQNDHIYLSLDPTLFDAIIRYLRFGQFNLTHELNERLDEFHLELQYLGLEEIRRFLPERPADRGYLTVFVGAERKRFHVSAFVLREYFSDSLLCAMLARKEDDGYTIIELTFPERDADAFRPIEIYHRLIHDLHVDFLGARRRALIRDIVGKLSVTELTALVRECKFFLLPGLSYELEKMLVDARLGVTRPLWGTCAVPLQLERRCFTELIEIEPEPRTRRYFLCSSSRNLAVSTMPTMYRDLEMHKARVSREPHLCSLVDWLYFRRMQEHDALLGSFRCCVSMVEQTARPTASSRQSASQFDLPEQEYIFGALYFRSRPPPLEPNNAPNGDVEALPTPRFLNVIYRLHVNGGPDGYERHFARDAAAWRSLRVEIETLIGGNMLAAVDRMNPPA